MEVVRARELYPMYRLGVDLSPDDDNHVHRGSINILTDERNGTEAKNGDNGVVYHSSLPDGLSICTCLVLRDMQPSPGCA